MLMVTAGDLIPLTIITKKVIGIEKVRIGLILGRTWM